MIVSISQDIIPLIANIIVYGAIWLGGLSAILILLTDEWGEHGKAFLVAVAICLLGFVGLFFLKGGSIVL